MMRAVSLLLTLSAGLFFAGLLILAIPSFMDPRFEVLNRSAREVSVYAAWRDRRQALGTIPSMSSVKFSLDDEAAMSFEVVYPEGSTTRSESRYFTRGTLLIATVSERAVKLRYDFES